MIHYYEATGLLRPPLRRANRYRDDGEVDVDELRFIRRPRSIGFSTVEIVDLLSLWRDRSRASRDVHRLATRHLTALEGRIAAMRAMMKSVR